MILEIVASVLFWIFLIMLLVMGIGWAYGKLARKTPPPAEYSRRMIV